MPSSCAGTFTWQGLGEVPYSAFKLKTDFAEFDAELRYGIGSIGSDAGSSDSGAAELQCIQGNGPGACLAFLDRDTCAYDRSPPQGADNVVLGPSCPRKPGR